MRCPGSGHPAPARANGVTPCGKCGTRVALEPDPSGWGGAVYAGHEADHRSPAEAAVWPVEPIRGGPTVEFRAANRSASARRWGR